MHNARSPLSFLSILFVFALSIGLFSGGTALMVQSGMIHANPIAMVLGDDDEDDDGDDEDEDDDEDEKDDDEDDENEDDDDTDARKRAEKEREEAKKMAEREKKLMKEVDDDEDDEDENDDDDSDEEKSELIESISELEEKIAEAEEEILEKQSDGVDVSAAIARLAEAKEKLSSYRASIESGKVISRLKDLEREIKKLIHFAKENDFHDAKKAAERLKQATEKIAKARMKISFLRGIGGSVGTLESELLRAQTLISEGKAMQAAGNMLQAESLFKEAKHVAATVKDHAESSIFALGGFDDDFDDDHETFAEEISDDLDDLAEIESNEDRVASLSNIAVEQKQSALKTVDALKTAQARSAFAKFFFGANDDALDSLSETIAKNNRDAATLQSLAHSANDPDIRELLLEQAGKIRSENAKLQAFVSSQSSSRGIFGWLTGLL